MSAICRMSEAVGATDIELARGRLLFFSGAPGFAWTAAGQRFLQTRCAQDDGGIPTRRGLLRVDLLLLLTCGTCGWGLTRRLI